MGFPRVLEQRSGVNPAGAAAPRPGSEVRTCPSTVSRLGRVSIAEKRRAGRALSSPVPPLSGWWRLPVRFIAPRLHV